MHDYKGSMKRSPKIDPSHLLVRNKCVSYVLVLTIKRMLIKNQHATWQSLLF